jgi:hypothetical protein
MTHRFYTLFCILSILSGSAADNARFFRILKLYSDPVYHASDRKLFIEGEYNSTSNDSVPKETGFAREYDKIQNFKRTASHDLGVKGVWLRGDAWLSRRTDLNAGLKGEYACSSMVRSNELIGRADIEQYLNVGENLYLDLSQSSDRYFSIRGRQKGFLGYKVWSTALIEGIVHRDSINSQLSSHSISVRGDKSTTITEYIGLEPSVGWGKPVFVTPIYRAFAIERALKKAGAVQGDLSDKTMVRIAQWLAAGSSATEIKDRPRKYIFAALDTILKKDSAAIKSPQTTDALMNAIEKHDNAFPFFFDGVKLSIAGNMNVASGYEEMERKLPGVEETLYGGDGFFFNSNSYFPFLKLEWGIVFSPYLFFSLGGKTPPLFPSYWKDLEVRSDYQLKLDGSFYYLINERLYLDMGFCNLLLGVKMDINQPDQLFLRGHYFIEDKVELVLALTHGYVENPYFYFNYRSIQTITDRITLGLQYEF